MSASDEANAPEVGRAKLFRNGRNQAVRVPREYELDGDEAFIHRETGRLIIEPVARPRSLAKVPHDLKPLDEDLAEPDDPAPNAEDVF